MREERKEDRSREMRKKRVCERKSKIEWVQVREWKKRESIGIED